MLPRTDIEMVKGNINQRNRSGAGRIEKIEAQLVSLPLADAQLSIELI